MKHQRIDIESARRDHHAQITDKWRARHPEAAKAQRAMRKHQSMLKERFGHKREGTLETLDRASRITQGALARMFMGGHLTADQLAWGAEIRAIAERIGRDVSYGTFSLETRVDNSASRSRVESESLGRVRGEVAYSGWRSALARPGPVLAMIVDDRAVRPVAQAFRMRDATLRAMLNDALDAWPDYCRDARDRVSEADLRATEAALI
ncbi:MAG: hypothetical protein AAF650_04805 [Pseudomonadota bacterium]